jgi:hypothetical protein
MDDFGAERVWSDRDAMTIPLTLLFVDRYGSAGLWWEPRVWLDEIKQDTGVALPDGNLNRLSAGALVLTQPDRFARDHRAFELACRMMSSTGFRGQYADLADVNDVAWGALEATLLHPVEWGVDVTTYCVQAMREAGLVHPPYGFKELKLVTGPIGDWEADRHPAEHGGQQAAMREVEAFVRRQMSRLVAQLQALDLRDGSTKSLVARILPLVK